MVRSISALGSTLLDDIHPGDYEKNNRILVPVRTSFGLRRRGGKT